MRYLQLFSICISIFLNSCEPGSSFRLSQSDFLIEPADLSSLGAKLVYIPLDDAIPFKSIYFTRGIYNKIGVYTDMGLFLFDHQGNLIREIGRQGTGPGECRVIDDFCINDSGTTLFMLSRNKINVYSIEGEFITSFEPFNSKFYERIEYYNNSFTPFCQVELDDERNLVYWIDALTLKQRVLSVLILLTVN